MMGGVVWGVDLEWYNLTEAEKLSTFRFNNFLIRGLAAEIWTVRDRQFWVRKVSTYLFWGSANIWLGQPGREITAGVSPYKPGQAAGPVLGNRTRKEQHLQRRRITSKDRGEASHCGTLPGQTESRSFPGGVHSAYLFMLRLPILCYPYLFMQHLYFFMQHLPLHSAPTYFMLRLPLHAAPTFSCSAYLFDAAPTYFMQSLPLHAASTYFRLRQHLSISKFLCSGYIFQILSFCAASTFLNSKRLCSAYMSMKRLKFIQITCKESATDIYTIIML
jgi:hypothetical protein